MTINLVHELRERIQRTNSVSEKINLSFDAHFNLVSIHPFYDGTGRTAWLLMNLLQSYYNLPLAIVHNESKVEYIQALIDTREKGDIEIFRSFMQKKYATFLNQDIEKLEDLNDSKKGLGFGFLF